MSPVIVCVGDSLTEGVFTKGYPQVLQGMLRQQQPNCQWVVKACCQHGASTSVWLSGDLIQKFKQTTAGGCDAIVIMLGTNDVRVGAQPAFDEQGFTERLTQLARKLMSEAPGAMIFLASPPPVAMDEKLNMAFCFDTRILHSTFPRLIPQIAENLGVNYIDIFSALGGSNASSSFYGDSYHLVKEGDVRVAAAVCDHVANRLCGTAVAGNHMASTANSMRLPIPKASTSASYPATKRVTCKPVMNEPNDATCEKSPTSASDPAPGGSAQRMHLMYKAPTVGKDNTVSPTPYNTVSPSYKMVEAPQSQTIVPTQIRHLTSSGVIASNTTPIWGGASGPRSTGLAYPRPNIGTNLNCRAVVV